MVKIDELPENLKKKVSGLFKAIDKMENRPEHPGFGPIYMIPEHYAVFLLKEFIAGADSWTFLNRPDDIKALKDFLDENNKTELLRDLLEIEYKLSKLPAARPCYA